ncbi:MAG TPA: polyhydroxyalkanoate synthesis regulator DNA-binding domain-containing protein, partial [Anaerolineae bacterium]|nr:polyhydroxyalkanoate synthesis regulator DNA-binding domain-containing protein [Anaerolineae bacterium]
KLYDMEEKRYISLRGIAALVREGEDVQVLDNETGDDITSLILSQILREQERAGSLLPPPLLTALVRRGSGGLAYLRGSLQSSLHALKTLEDDLDQRIEALAQRGEISLSEAQELREEMAARAQERQAEAEERILEEIEGSLVRLGVPTRSDIQGLQNQLDGIAAKVHSLVALRGQDTSH